MSKQALKFQLHQFIDTIEDEETLLVLNESFNSIKKVIVFQHTNSDITLVEGRDVLWQD